MEATHLQTTHLNMASISAVYSGLELTLSQTGQLKEDRPSVVKFLHTIQVSHNRSEGLMFSEEFS